ncbi:squalene--hopene cyclase [Paenibacillus alkalitolerans]|uniref:squalene--hopene cyclase n=1 Tax=Paenibacillus alkalitolerans TaxID=2799335 RepID=UPI0018F5D48B|nr:squalene--hopene cyclase [Paenibacillus alkalitolerans]
MKNKVESEMNRMIELLHRDQSPDGAWRYCLESGPLTDAYMIILLRVLQIDDEDFIRELTARISGIQNKNGAWKLYHDEEEGNLSASIEAYYALLFSGYYRKTDKNMQAAKHFILSKGGIPEASTLTKVMLALTGQYPWPRHLLIPVELLLLPQTFPIHFFDFVGYARVHVAPILVCADRKFVIKTDDTPDLSDLFTEKSTNVNPDKANSISNESRSILHLIRQGIKNLPILPRHIHSIALRRAEQFMLERIEPDGTLYSYFTSTFLMIFALMALGYPKDSHVISRAITGLKTLTCRTNGHIHVQNATSTVWNTALLSHALQEAGVSTASPIIQKAGVYLLSRQHRKYGDWVQNNPHVLPGGWGFSDINTINPDVDDTTASLRAIRRLGSTDATYRDAWNRGLHWLLSMQNADGGWPAFEKNTDKRILTWIPIDGSKSTSIDPSTADLTGRTLEFLGKEAGLTIHHPIVERGVRWLLMNQEKDGSWYGRWGISYVYGTWAAVTGMAAVGVSPYHPSIQKAVRWLLKIQNADGGWGESCRSDMEKRYVSLGVSTPSQTGWALDALISVFKEPIQAIDRGVLFLTESARKQDWTTSYPTGAGLPGGFYFHYHSYRYVWPLLALSHYKKKYMN